MKSSRMPGKRSGCTFRIFQGVFLLFTLILFRHELGRIWMYLRALGDLVLGVPVTLPDADVLLRESLYMALNVVCYAFFGYMLVYLISGSIFPLQAGVGRWEMIKRFNQFFFGARRPVIHVREGRLVRDLPLGETGRGGIAVIDANSVIVLEKFSVPKDGKSQLSDIGRPGVRLIDSWERLHSTISLRHQVRSNKDVSAKTIDGIDVKTNISVVFTLGQPASVIKVAYDGEQVAENLRVLSIDAESKQITAITDELDAEDKREIHTYAQAFVPFDDPSAPLEPVERGQNRPPYTIDEERIRAAAYALARNPLQDKVDSWTDLPAQVATEIFRNLLAKESYDALYIADPADMYSLQQRPPGKFILQEVLKPAFSQRVRYQGVMSYQFLHHIYRRPPKVGLRVDNQRYRISPVRNLTNPRLLRNLGIKVIAASFSELKPSPKVYAQRLETWRARNQQKVDLERAKIEQEVISIRNKARLEAQQDFMQKLEELYLSNKYTEDALAWAIVDSLDSLASQPGTRRLLPSDTVKMLRDATTMLIANVGQTTPNSPVEPDKILPSPPQNDAGTPPESTGDSPEDPTA